MNAVLEHESSDVDFGQFFAPAPTDLFTGLLSQYRGMRQKIEQVGKLFEGDLGGVVGYFISGNSTTDRGYSSLMAEKVFEVKGAIASLNAGYWDRTLRMTDVLDYMPQKRRDEWFKSIREMTCPDFTEEAVRPTISSLLNMRQQFLAERVDGIFRSLSHDHVTNCPEGFSKRMIINYVLSSYGFPESSRVGYINDLRCVIAKFMGRGEPKYSGSNAIVEKAKSNYGQWISVDGGALRIRVYKKGTAHLEVHPEMAWRLNAILASLYPAAIPESFRRKPKNARPPKGWEIIQRPLPFEVLEQLDRMRPAREFNGIDNHRNSRFRDIENALEFEHGIAHGPIRTEAERVLSSIGGVKTELGYWQFDYPAGSVVTEIVCSGCVPDHKTHQFYPTPETVAQAAIEMADIGPEDSCLEPEAGVGGLADHMPKDRTTCVEISTLHCSVLTAKGYKVIHADFLDWAAKTSERFTRVVMNPPFSEGRWIRHLESAAGLLTKNGIITAVLPASAKNKDLLPGFTHEWSQVFANEFDGTGVSVVILKATKKPTKG